MSGLRAIEQAVGVDSKIESRSSSPASLEQRNANNDSTLVRPRRRAAIYALLHTREAQSSGRHPTALQRLQGSQSQESPMREVEDVTVAGVDSPTSVIDEEARAPAQVSGPLSHETEGDAGETPAAGLHQASAVSLTLLSAQSPTSVVAPSAASADFASQPRRGRKRKIQNPGTSVREKQCRSIVVDSRRGSLYTKTVPHPPKKRRYRRQGQDQDETQSLSDLARAFGAETDTDWDQFEAAIKAVQSHDHWNPHLWIPRNLLSGTIADTIQYMQCLPGLMKELEINQFSRRILRVRKRIALVLFYRTYRLAHTNSDTFLKETNKMSKEKAIALTSRRGRLDSIIKNRFIDILFWQSGTSRAEASRKVDHWQSDGKPWAELVDRLGYGSLLLVPLDITDER